MDLYPPRFFDLHGAALVNDTIPQDDKASFTASFYFDYDGIDEVEECGVIYAKNSFALDFGQEGIERITGDIDFQNLEMNVISEPV